MGRESWPKCGCSQRCSRPVCVHSGGRVAQAESGHLSIVGRKYSPERLSLFLRKLIEFPNVTKACLFAGFTFSTLRYWLRKSQAGRPGDGFDLEFCDEHKRFHEHYDDALQGGIQMVEDGYVERAISGYYETLHHQGRVAYQYDQGMLDLGYTGPDAYLRDEFGKPVPERIHNQDPEVMLAVLKAWRRDRYGQHDTLDVTHRGGVMVVTAPARTSKELEARAEQMAGEPIDVEFTDADPNVPDTDPLAE